MVAITTLSDIAGQVTESAANADKVTVAGVCLPAGDVKRIRSLIPTGFPKWRDASDAELDFMVGLVIKLAWSACAASLDKTTPDWTKFWRDAREVHARTASLSGGSIGFLKAATLVKFILFGQSSAFALGHAVKVGTLPKVLDRKGRLHVAEAAVFDNEIHGFDSREAMVDLWKSMNAHQPKLNSIGIHHEVTSLSLVTESSEPLLLLPDYVAGIVHADSSSANTLSKSEVSVAAARRALLRLRASRKFHAFEPVMPASYFEIFPDFKKYGSQDAP